MQKKDENNHKWVQGIMTIGFDLEEGQVPVHIFPENFLPKPVLLKISALAFPDTCAFSSNSELFFMFKIEHEDSVFFCYSLFTQKKDETLPRGYFQHSLVLVSTICSPSVFHKTLLAMSETFYRSNMDRSVVELSFSNLTSEQTTPEAEMNKGKFCLCVADAQIEVCFK